MAKASKRNSTSAYRALTLFTTLPANHKTIRVDDDGAAPHLSEDEFAVIDTTDREPQHGELYVIEYSTNRSIVQARSSYCNITGPGAEDTLVWWVRALRGFRKTNKQFDGVPLYAGMTSGPYEADGFKAMLLGRVVGYAYSPLGGLVEALKPRTFTEAEYIEAARKMGFVPRRDEDGRLHFVPGDGQR